MSMLLLDGRSLSVFLTAVAYVALATAGCASPSSADALPVSNDPTMPPPGGNDPGSSNDAPLMPTPGPGSGVAAAAPDHATAECPAGAAAHPFFCDGFEEARLSTTWSPSLLEGGAVHLKKGGATGASSMGAAFGKLPGAPGKAALTYALPASVAADGAGVRFSVHVVKDGYPSRLGIAALQGAAGSAFALELDGGTKLVVRDTAAGGVSQTVGDIPFDAWTCVSVELDAKTRTITTTLPSVTHVMPLPTSVTNVALGSVEVGLTYGGGANPNASVGIGFDDVVIGHGLSSCP